MGKRIRVKKDEKEPESKEVLAEAIVAIGKASKRLSQSGVNRKGVVILLHHHSRVPMRTIETVLDSMKQLEAWYCR